MTKLTPKQREFLEIASREEPIRRVTPLNGAFYWRAGSVKLRDKWGTELRSLGLIEQIQRETGNLSRMPYRITDLGRTAIKLKDGIPSELGC